MVSREAHAALDPQGNKTGDPVEIRVRVQKGEPVPQSLIGDQEIHRFCFETPASQPLSPLSRFQPIGFRQRELVQAGEVLAPPVELLSGRDAVQKLKQDGRGNGGPVVPDQIGDPVPNMGHLPRREVEQPCRSID